VVKAKVLPMGPPDGPGLDWRAGVAIGVPAGTSASGLALGDARTRSLRQFKDLFKSGWLIFSEDFDVTHTQQRLADAQKGGRPEWDERLVWNLGWLQPFARAPGLEEARRRFLLQPVIFGFAAVATADVDNVRVDYGLIARRSRLRTGVRYCRRGLDDEGHCANFVETEQVVRAGDAVSSFVTVRGSIPLFWSQDDSKDWTQINPPVKVDWDEGGGEAGDWLRHAEGMRRHVIDLRERYGRVLVLNLVDQAGPEGRLGKMFRDVFTSLVEGRGGLRDARAAAASLGEGTVRVIDDQVLVKQHPGARDEESDLDFFDFALHAHAHDWQAGQQELQDVFGEDMKQIRSCQVFLSSLPSRESKAVHVLMEQKGVVRVNCIDCLDRTNLAQSVLARWVLGFQLECLGVLDTGERRRAAAAGDALDALHSLHHKAWTAQGDALSLQYAGSSALRSDLTMHGEFYIWCSII